MRKARNILLFFNFHFHSRFPFIVVRDFDGRVAVRNLGIITIPNGICHNCTSPDSICSYVHFLRNSRQKGRHVVVLVGEDLGY